MTLTTVPELNHHETVIPDYHNYDGQYHRMIQGYRNFSPAMYFYLRTKQLPKIISFDNLDSIKAVEAICAAYHVDMKYALTNNNVNLEKGTRKLESVIV